MRHEKSIQFPHHHLVLVFKRFNYRRQGNPQLAQSGLGLKEYNLSPFHLLIPLNIFLCFVFFLSSTKKLIFNLMLSLSALSASTRIIRIANINPGYDTNGRIHTVLMRMM